MTCFRGPVLEDDPCSILQRKMKDSKHILQVVEVRAGLGEIGKGAEAAGWEVKAQNVLMESFCSHQGKFSTIPVTEGSICNMGTVAAIHRAAPSSGSLAMGVSCQPFSRAGDRQRGMDGRAPYGLLQKEITVLECVALAASSPFVQRCSQSHSLTHSLAADRSINPS